jgi:RNA polymerase sigma factor (sigma-70 family)
MDVMKPEELLAHADFLGSLAHSLILDENRAQDIAQETWLAALKHPPAGVKNLRAWLAKAFARPEGIPSTEEIVEEEEIRSKVVEAVLGLDEPYRDVIVLRYYRELPNKEVAKRLGLPLETMRTRLKKGLSLLRSRLDRVYHGDRKKWLLALAPLPPALPRC